MNNQFISGKDFKENQENKTFYLVSNEYDESINCYVDGLNTQLGHPDPFTSRRGFAFCCFDTIQRFVTPSFFSSKNSQHYIREAIILDDSIITEQYLANKIVLKNRITLEEFGPFPHEEYMMTLNKCVI